MSSAGDRRREATADIKVFVGSVEVVVERLSVEKDIDVEEIYGSSATLPDGFSINQIGYSGNFTCKGNKKDLEELFFDGNGIPEVLDAISITHFNGSSTDYNEILCTNEGYEANSGETTETSYEFVAMSKDGDVDPT